MGTFRAGQWFISLLIYFVIFYLGVLSIFSIKAQFYHADPGTSFSGDPNTLIITDASRAGLCSKPTEFTDPISIIHCQDLSTNNGSCGLVQGCTWANVSHWFSSDTQECQGDVNLVQFGLNSSSGLCSTGSNSSNLCLNTNQICSAMRNMTFCRIFQCTWVNNSEIFSSTPPGILDSPKQINAFWESAKFMLGLRTELGFVHYGWIFAIFFTYIESLMLIYSGYMMIRGG